MWEALKVRNNLTKTITKKLAIVLFAVAITLFNVGCTPKPVEAIDSPTTENSPVSPEAKPTPPVETRSPRELELEALLEKAPEIPGLTKSISENKIIYQDDTGKFSGEFNRNVFVEGIATGGVALIPEVALKLLNEALDKIPAGEQKAKIIIPLEISDLEDQNSVKIEQVISTRTNTSYILVNPSKGLDLINITPGDQRLSTSNNSVNTIYKSAAMDYDLSLLCLTNLVIINEINNDNLINNLKILIPKDSLPFGIVVNSTFGDRINYTSNYPEVKISSPFIIGASTTTHVFPMGISDLLTVGENNTPIFIKALVQ